MKLDSKKDEVFNASLIEIEKKEEHNPLDKIGIIQTI